MLGFLGVGCFAREPVRAGLELTCVNRNPIPLPPLGLLGA